MENQIEQVKIRVDIVGLVSGYVSLKKAGRNYKGLCPFHSEKTASFMVSAERQIFKCFGCGEGGDAIAFYQKIEGVEFGEALKRLADKVGVVLKEYKENPLEKQKETIKAINTKAAEFYHYILLKHATGRKALEYLKDRGLNEKSIKEWQLGYAPDSWDNVAKFLAKKGFQSADVVKSGLGLPSQRQGLYDRFRKRIIFPIKNISGETVAFSGRIFGEGEPKYLNSPDTLIFNKSNNLYGLDLAKAEIKKVNSTVLVEGNLDVISSFQVGIKNVVCPLGTALTEKQLGLLRRFSDNLVLSFDQDTSGVAATKRAVEMAESLGLNLRLTNFPEKDPDELIKKNPAAWEKTVADATPVYDYLIDKAIKNNGTGNSESLRKVTTEVAPYLARIENEITRSHYERLLASRLSVSEESVRREIEKKKIPGSSQTIEVKIEQGQNVSDRLVLEKYLLALVLQTKNLSPEIRSSDFENRQLQSLYQLLETEPKLDLKRLQTEIPAELNETFDQLTLLELPAEILKDEAKIRQEIKTCAVRLKELNLRARLRKLTLAIKQAEIGREEERLESLENEFNQISKNLAALKNES